MRFILSAKIIMPIVFILLAILGCFLLKSPVDHLQIFTVNELVIVIFTVIGIAGVTKVVQAKLESKSKAQPPIVDWLQKLFGIVDPTQGVFMAIMSFILATILYAYRIPIITFELWLGYYVVFQGYFNVINVSKKT